jgi:predicted  nucleic acid-binding Zn-ribbon protein
MTQVHQLYQLQEIDTEIREKKQRLGEVLQILKGPDWLLRARGGLETAVNHLHTLQSQRNQLNLELQSLSSKTKASENRLYSGKVTNPKEMSDLQSEIGSLNKRTAGLEDEMLEVMLLMEDGEAHRATADEAATKAETRWQKESADLQRERDELAVRLNKLLEMRQGQAAVIDAASLQEYEQLLKKKGGTAVARVRVDMCLGCRTTISANKIKEAKEGKKAYCGSCGRIIYPY